MKEIPILNIVVFDVDNLLGYDTNAYQLIQHVVAACLYLNFSHTNVNGLATPLVNVPRAVGVVAVSPDPLLSADQLSPSSKPLLSSLVS